MYVARDKNRDLYQFYELSNRGNECWWAETGVDGTYLRLEKPLYPEITWESDLFRSTWSPKKVTVN